VRVVVGAAALLFARILSGAEPGAIPSVSFGRHALDVVRTHIYTDRGTLAAKANLNSPGPNDFPPHLSIGLETGKEADGQGRFLIFSTNYLRVYNIAEVKTAPYKTIQPNLLNLERLLKGRPPRPPNFGKNGEDWKQEHELPNYPPRNAGHLIEAKLSYVDAPWGSGVMYITQFVQGLGETPNNEQLVCVFQGLSKKKQRFVAADFHITHPAVPATSAEPTFDWRKPGEQKAAEEFCDKIERTLNSAADESFTPSLRSIREWLVALKLDE
jgi:hypothetical protein